MTFDSSPADVVTVPFVFFLASLPLRTAMAIPAGIVIVRGGRTSVRRFTALTGTLPPFLAVPWIVGQRPRKRVRSRPFPVQPRDAGLLTIAQGVPIATILKGIDFSFLS